MTNNPSENIWDEFVKTSKILKAGFFQFSAKIMKRFVLSS